MAPILSIITPTYNGEKFIRSCIQNVIEQNCQNLEHIIVDGGSTDQTVNIIESYSVKHPHIHWISEPDQGQSDALNKGILMAKGEIIGILNVDDYYEPEILKEVFDLFRAFSSQVSKPIFLVGRCNVWSDENTLKYIYTPKSLKLLDLLLGQKFHPTPVNPTGYFYHRSLHTLVGLYDVNEEYAMDFDFIYRAIPYSQTIKTSSILGNFRYQKHTKTYHNLVENDNKSINQDVRNRYIKSLPDLQKLYLKGLLFYNHIVLLRSHFFLQAKLTIKRLILEKFNLQLHP